MTHTSVAETLALMSSVEIAEWQIWFDRADAADAARRSPVPDGRRKPNLRGT